MTLARWLCAVACCIALLSACKGGDDDDGSPAKDAGSNDGRDAASGGGGNGGSSASGSGGESGNGASGDAGGDRDASAEMMSDGSSETGGSGGASGDAGGAGGTTGSSGNETNPDKCGGATCPEPSVCDHESDPPVCKCPEGYHYVDVGGGASPCAMDCEGADCDAGS